MTVRTRFAPSPTGYLHIGGVRTALFNWLFSRQHDGIFVLRVDDTDQQRNVDETLQPILDGFRWLDLDWDEGPEVGGEFGPYFQSQRGDLYQAAVSELVESGAAYYDYASPDELQEEREAAQAAGTRFIYSRRWAAASEEERRRFEAEGRAGVVRLKMPREGVCTFHDLIRGDMEFDWASEQDHVIQRPDGSVLYHLASAVDDHAMEISHVIRAEEHLSNTARQIFIAQSLGYELPAYAHLPVVAEPGSKTKLSKRKLDKYLRNPDFAQMYEHGRKIAAAIGVETSADTFSPVIVDFYREVGYLPDAIVNYLLLLGWALDDRTEFFTRQEMIAGFDLDRVNKSPASFDPNKLMAFEERHMQEVSVPEKLVLVTPFLEQAGYVDTPITDGELGLVEQILEAAGDRLKVAGDILEYREFFVSDFELEYDEKAYEKRLLAPDGASALLRRYADSLAGLGSWDAGTLEEHMREFVESEDIKLGDIIHAVRVATTGKGVGFGMFESLEILGKARVLSRIDRALARVS